MGVKVCHKCRSTNAVGNSLCIRCGQDLSHERITHTEKKGNIYLYAFNQAFNKFLIGGAVISLIMLMVAVMNPSTFHVLALFGKGG